MKLIHTILLASGLSLLSSGCIREFEPQGDKITSEQLKRAPASFQPLVDAITNDLVGGFPYGRKSSIANDFGLPAMFLKWDVTGQDIFNVKQNWWGDYYTVTNLSESFRNPQVPWTYFYRWINSCNRVISLAGENPEGSYKFGAGIAHAMRAYFYQALAQMYAPKTYTADKTALTVPIVTGISGKEINPRATNEVIWQFIISDLDMADKYLEGYKRTTKEVPDQSVVWGLKARAYLVMGEWTKAAEYAKTAQAGYTIMTKEEYTSKEHGFNTPNNSWMLCCQYKADDPGILQNDGDSSWGSFMIHEIDPVKSQCGYAANYGEYFVIDRHLYETIPSTDFRKDCFVDFKIDQSSKEEQLEQLKKYTDYPEWVQKSAIEKDNKHTPGGISLKFRATGGADGHVNQKIGWVVAIPMMRVEEMYLIEAEAKGMNNEGEGQQLLETFAKQRDPEYVYGQHQDAYYNENTKKIQNEVWWQRRVEFWGEGLAMFDIKRLEKGIIRSYPNSNHIDQYRWNINHTPDWMNFVIVGTETAFNPKIPPALNNPAPAQDNGNSPEFTGFKSVEEPSLDTTGK